MKFSRINDTTINCIISEEELAGSGITLDDIMSRQGKAVEYLRRVVMEAVRQENFHLDAAFTSMQIGVMRDGSLSLTISSDDPSENGAAPDPLAAAKSAIETLLASMRESASSKDAAAPDDKETAKTQENGEQKTTGPAEPGQPRRLQYCYTFLSMADVIECCRRIPGAGQFTSSLWKNEEEGIYQLLLSARPEDAQLFEQALVAMNEFGSLADAPAEAAAYIMEHDKCILKENAAAQLASM